MSQSLNQITLIGRVGKDPQYFNTKSGNKIATFTLATTDVRKDLVNQELIKDTQWHKIVILNTKLIPIVEKMVSAGSNLFLIGKVQYQKYTSNSPSGEQITKISTEVTIKDFSHQLIVLDSKRNQDTHSHKNSANKQDDEDLDFLENDSNLDDDNF